MGPRPGKELLLALFREAVAAADPRRLVAGALGGCPGPRGAPGVPGAEGAVLLPGPTGKVWLAGGGKAGAAMAEAAAAAAGGRLAGGVVAVPRGRGGRLGAVRLVEAGHPVPDGGSREAASATLGLLAAAGEADLVLALLSGGGSAMIALPPPGVPPGEKEEVVRILLRSGAAIGEFNAVRKHLSAVKGGRLAAAARRCRVLALVLSDVPGDDLSVVASGPFAPDPTTYADALRILVDRRLCAAVPPAAREHLEAGVAGRLPDTPKPGDPVFRRVAARLVGSNACALEGAAAAARELGADPVLLPGFLSGDAGACARRFAALLLAARDRTPAGRTAVLVAGGETTVGVRGPGSGGRSQSFALAAALAFAGEEGVALLAAGTDGVDGPTDAAGAYADGTTADRAAAGGHPPAAHLDADDAWPLFRALGDLVVTGPTGTNVADVALGAAAGRA